MALHIERLRCPLSGAALRFEALGAGGVLRGTNTEWPVVQDIAVFRETPEAARALALLDDGDELGAAAALCGEVLRDRRDRIRGRMEQWILRRPAGEGPAARRARERIAALEGQAFPEAVRAFFGQSPWPVTETADYFVDRRADPTFAVAEALALTLLDGRGRVLDLGCGTGHLLCSLAAMPGADSRWLVGVDALFPALLLARRYLAPLTQLVCCDADGLPFREDVFDAVVSVDAFFDFPSLPRSAAEAHRVLAGDGMALFCHLHNRLMRHIYAGRCPLSPQEYLEVLAPLGPALLDERDVDCHLVDPRGELRPARDAAQFAESADLVAVGGRYPASFAIDLSTVPAPVGRWRVSPAYERVGGAAGVLRRREQRFITEEESGAYECLLPASFEISEALAAALPSSERPYLPDAIRARVVIPLPGCYDEPPADPARPGSGTPRPRRHRTGLPRAARELRSQTRAGSLAEELRRLADERLPRGGLAILAGHRVTASRGPDPLDLCLPAPQLEVLLDALADCATLLDFDRAMEALLEDKLPRGLSATLSFDDGSEDLLENAPAVLARVGLRAGVFVTGTEAAAGGRYLWDGRDAGGRRADTKGFAAREDVFVLGHHTRSHRALERLAPDEMAEELLELDVDTGPWLAYPFGQAADAGPRAAACAREAGFRVALTTRPGIARAGDDLHLLPRMPLRDVPADSLLRNLIDAVGEIEP